MTSHASGAPASTKRTLVMALGALGVVYGDIGTSPLYAVKECFHGLHAITLSPANVLGVLSLIFWSLTVVITVKYVSFILRADNKGEGGMFALVELLPARKLGQRAVALTAEPLTAAEGRIGRDHALHHALLPALIMNLAFDQRQVADQRAFDAQAGQGQR